MKLLPFIAVCALFSCLHTSSYAQSSSIYDPAKDPRVYLRPFYDRLDIKADEDAENNCDERHFMRWLNVWAGRMRPDGSIRDFPDENLLSAQHAKAAYKTTGNPPAWQSLGPSHSLPGSGIGMVHCIAFHPTKKNIIYAGAADGGFWISTDTGAHWITTTDQVGQIGINDIFVDPHHPDTIYVSTGDKDFWACTSVGLIKSTDGGYTWSSTGLVFAQTDNMEMIRTRMDPNNSSVLFTAVKTAMFTSNVYKSTDAGATWNIVFSLGEEISDLQIHPTNGNYVYFGTRVGSFYRTSDGGTTWQNLTSNVGYVNPGGGEDVTLAVTPASPNSVYLMAQGNPDTSDMNCGVYVSANEGTSFTKMADNSTPQGQVVQWYGYVMAVSPTNVNRIYVGGGYTYQSDDEGATFTSVSNSGNGNFVHVDIHDLQLRTNNEAFIGCDGGIYRCTNLSGPYWTWTDISSDMTISQLYGFSSAANSRSMFVMGMQDNGSGVVRADQMFNYGIGGDGQQPAVNPLDSNNFYEAAQTGDFYKTYDGGQSWIPFIYSNITGEGGDWTTPISICAQDTNVVWTGYVNVWKTRDQGVNWYKLGTTPPNSAGAPIQRLYIAPTDTNIIYIIFQWGYGMFKTLDNGAHWTSVNNNPPDIEDFTVDSANPYHIWAASIGNFAGQKVYESTDTATTWTNISYNLPNVPISSIVYENKPPHRLFAGTDIGIYYLDPADTVWQLFGTGLPNVVVTKLEIHNLTNTLRAGTYGRGLWQCTLDTTSVVVTSVTNTNTSGANQFKVFPNPAKNTISVTATNGISNILITNVLGQEIFTQLYHTDHAYIDISGFTPGIYFIKVNDSWVQKLLKE